MVLLHSLRKTPRKKSMEMRLLVKPFAYFTFWRQCLINFEHILGKTPKRTLKGGLIVEDLKIGNGLEAKRGKQIGVYYVGKLKANNKQFDSTKESGKPFKFRLGQGEVIKAWDLAIEGMKVVTTLVTKKEQKTTLFVRLEENDGSLPHRFWPTGLRGVPQQFLRIPPLCLKSTAFL